MDSIQFKFYRNVVIRTRKRCKAQFYESKVQRLNPNDPKSWWSEFERLSGALSSPDDLRNHINIEDLNNLPLNDLAIAINNALLEPLEDYRLANPLVPLPLEDVCPVFLEVTEHRVFKMLCKLNQAKACGPDSIPNWFLKEHAGFLAYPITTILKSSFKEHRMPSVWKLADVTPIPKKKPVKINFLFLFFVKNLLIFYIFFLYFWVFLLKSAQKKIVPILEISQGQCPRTPIFLLLGETIPGVLPYINYIGMCRPKGHEF